MSEPTIGGFFSGGGRSAKFPALGSKVEGVITKVHPPEQQTDYESRQPIPGKYQVRIELDTDERDPNVDGDDGSRVLYVKGWMQGAVGDALRQHGITEPQVGGKLAVTWSSVGPPTRPGLQGPHQYTAVYTPPAAGFFAPKTEAAQAAPAAGNGQPAQAPIPAEPPAGIDPAAWAVMPPESKQAIANVMAASKP